MNQPARNQSFTGRAILVAWIAYLCLCTAFGEAFYKFAVFGLSSSEFIVLGVIAISLSRGLRRFLDFFSPLMIALGVYWLFAIFISIAFTDAKHYFIFRQGSHLFYFLSGLALAAVLTSTGNLRWAEDKSPLFLLAFMLSILASLVFNDSNRDASLPLLLSTLILCNGRHKLLALFCIAAFGLITGHASYILSILVFLLVAWSLTNRKVLPYLLCGVAILGAILLRVILSIEELSDVNALWRYLYWRDLVLSTTRDLQFLYGAGYGVPYIQPEFSYFKNLLAQVDSGQGVIYQMYTVPPHNSLLTIYYHLGIVPLVLFSAFLVRLFFSCYHYRLNIEFAALAALLVLMLTHNAIELPYISLGVSLSIALILVRIRHCKSVFRDFQSLYQYAMTMPSKA